MLKCLYRSTVRASVGQEGNKLAGTSSDSHRNVSCAPEAHVSRGGRQVMAQHRVTTPGIQGRQSSRSEKVVGTLSTPLVPMSEVSRQIDMQQGQHSEYLSGGSVESIERKRKKVKMNGREISGLACLTKIGLLNRQSGWKDARCCTFKLARLRKFAATDKCSSGRKGSRNRGSLCEVIRARIAAETPKLSRIGRQRPASSRRKINGAKPPRTVKSPSVQYQCQAC